MWALDGTREKAFTVLLAHAHADAEGDLGRVVAVDSTIVRAHQHAAGARQKGLRTASRATMPSDAPAAGRPRRSTSPPTGASGRSPSTARPARPATRPHSRRSWPASAFPGPSADRARRRPRTTPDAVLADKAYSSRAIRTRLRRRGIRAVIPQPADQAAHRKRRGSHGGRPPAFDRDAYKQRNTVERCIWWQRVSSRNPDSWTVGIRTSAGGSGRRGRGLTVEAGLAGLGLHRRTARQTAHRWFCHEALPGVGRRWPHPRGVPAAQ
ncbi:hypothetical protein CG736_02825 [Kitasatospora sp. CB02891]|nr:hypothetical protein CG736_02825 [Kitasatospora sp. CB02891]